MLETSFDNGDLELCLNCDICEASDTFYWDNFSDARSQGKAQGRKAKKIEYKGTGTQITFGVYDENIPARINDIKEVLHNYQVAVLDREGAKIE